MIRSNGSDGVYLEGRVSELFTEYEFIGMAIMEAGIANGFAESTLRAVMKNCCRNVLDHWEDFKEEHE